MASAAGFKPGQIRGFSELSFEKFELWKESVEDYQVINTKRHFKQDGEVGVIEVATEQLAALMRQSLDGAAAKVMLKLSNEQRKDPKAIAAALEAACRPNEQAEVCAALDELLSFSQGQDDEMTYLLRFDKIQSTTQKLLREKVLDDQGREQLVEHDLPAKMWGYIMKRGLTDELARRVVGSLGSLDPEKIRASIMGMAGERSKYGTDAGFAAGEYSEDGDEDAACMAFRRANRPVPRAEQKCYECNKKGHYARECPLRSQRFARRTGPPRGRGRISRADQRSRMPGSSVNQKGRGTAAGQGPPMDSRRGGHGQDHRTAARDGGRRGRGRGRQSGRGRFRQMYRAHSAADEGCEEEPELYDGDEYDEEDFDPEDDLYDQENEQL